MPRLTTSGSARATARPRARRDRQAAVVVVAALLALGTLAPFHPGLQPAIPWRCVACTPDGGADLVANLVAFVPLGIVLVRAGWPSGAAVFAGTLLSVAIELLQATGIAGRTAVLGDVVANAAGTAAGVGVVRAAVALRHATPAAARRAAAAVGVAWIAVMTASTWLLGRDAAPGPWPPRAGARATVPDLGWYDGRVVAFTLDGWTAGRPGSGPPGPGPLIVAARLGRRVRAQAELGDGDFRAGFVPAVAVLDAALDPVLLLGQHGTAAELRVRTRARRWRLREPAVVIPDAFASLRPGNPWRRATAAATIDDGAVTLTVRTGGPRVDIARAAARRPTPALGWTLVAPFGRAWGPERPLLDAMWVAALLVPFGYALELGLGHARAFAAGAAGLTLLAGLAIAPAVLGGAAAGPAAWAGAVGACAAGWTAARRARRARKPAAVDVPAASPARPDGWPPRSIARHSSAP